jgi:hypothetical protein
MVFSSFSFEFTSFFLGDHMSGYNNPVPGAYRPIPGYSQGYPPQVDICVDTATQTLEPIGPSLDTVKDIHHR